MFATLVTAALFVSSVLAQDGLLIQTPSFKQCKDAQIKWESGKGPYNVIIVPAEDPCADALYDLGDHKGKSTTWLVGLPAGADVMLSLLDSTGTEAWSGTITVEESEDDGCVPKELRKLAPEPVVSSSSAAAPSSSSAAAPSSSAEAESSSAAEVPETTPAVTTPNSVAPPSPPSNDEEEAGAGIPIGAANAGTNPFGGDDEGAAFAVSSYSAPVMVLGSILGAAALLL
ncbi:hypothetical protein BDV98DRAFT_639051 [Pterulicium gracile]|uniref:Ser-Thr-rich glycosyl-phosphatidyl-inositol-anchored membrane family-domain-containing protein n=1 Tax=Pterulicium gracile TaxID=1884261 RepID=A0A5C3QU09_9AGAR|nr:hypothetical protein BDV98DRAFT_639051 [Pterula gracilis]